jgi:hypothetical protein
MKLGVSETARLVETDRDTLKSWAYYFNEYLSSGANPPKGVPRCFILDDLYVLAYVAQYWEEHPDFENIRFGLNCGDHYDEPYREFVAAVTPLFQDPPEELDETWRHGGLVGGIVAGSYDALALADSYKRAGDILVDSALKSWEVSELLYPVLFNYRHATELYLKSITSPANPDHNLKPLLESLEETLRSEFNTEVPRWFKGAILDFVAFDPNSTTFRYGDPRAQWAGEHWVDLPHVKLRMSWLSASFHRIFAARWR